MSKSLFLIRHAKSSWDDPMLSDFDRPLNHRGLRNAPFMAEVFSRKVQEPLTIVSSPAKRAAETARAFAKALAIPETGIIWNSQIYEASASGLLQVIRHLPEQSNAVAIFGHNPGLTDLANILTGDSLANIPTCGIYAVEIQKPEWSQTDRQSGLRLWLDFPKNYI